jgi:hypothetical protein
LIADDIKNTVSELKLRERKKSFEHQPDEHEKSVHSAISKGDDDAFS